MWRALSLGRIRKCFSLRTAVGDLVFWLEPRLSQNRWDEGEEAGKINIGETARKHERFPSLYQEAILFTNNRLYLLEREAWVSKLFQTVCWVSNCEQILQWDRDSLLVVTPQSSTAFFESKYMKSTCRTRIMFELNELRLISHSLILQWKEV